MQRGCQGALFVLHDDERAGIILVRNFFATCTLVLACTLLLLLAMLQCDFVTKTSFPCRSTMSYTPGSSAPPSGAMALSMPNSYSSFAGIPGNRPPSHPPQHQGLGPGWSEHQPAERDEENVYQGGMQTRSAQPAGRLVVEKAKKKKSSWLCCLRPNLPEDDESSIVVVGKEGGGRSGGAVQAPKSNGGQTALSTSSENELVKDGVPLGGVTSTSEDVIQVGHGTVVQCNVGLSVQEENGNSHHNDHSMNGYSYPSAPPSAPNSGYPQPLSAGFAGIGKGQPQPLSSGFDGIGNGSQQPLSAGFDGIGVGNGAPLSAGFNGIGKAGRAGGSALTEANVSNLLGGPASRARRAAPTSGTSVPFPPVPLASAIR